MRHTLTIDRVTLFETELFVILRIPAGTYLAVRTPGSSHCATAIRFSYFGLADVSGSATASDRLLEAVADPAI